MRLDTSVLPILCLSQLNVRIIWTQSLAYFFVLLFGSHALTASQTGSAMCAPLKLRLSHSQLIPAEFCATPEP